MDKTVGSVLRSKALLIYVFFLCAMVVVSLKAQLVLLSQDGMPLKQVGINKPFMLQYTVDYSNQQDPQLEGAKDFQVQRTGFHMQSINGKATATYSCLVHAKKEGQFVVGPVRYVKDNKVQKTNSVTLTVGSKEIVDIETVNEKQKTCAYAKLIVPQKVIYVGDALTYSVRFYYLDQSTQVEQLLCHEFEKGSIVDDEQKSPKQRVGVESIGEVEYSFIEWEWSLPTKKAGRINLDPHRINFVQKYNSNTAQNRSMIWGSPVEYKKIYTQGSHVDVMPLPEYEGEIIGVGAFQRAKVELASFSAKEGEAIILSLSVIGKGTLAEGLFPTLKDIPAALKIYPSKKIVQSPSVKKFEYIVQGLAEGSYIIPEQEFVFFNPELHEYQVIATEPCKIFIAAGEKILQEEKEDFSDDSSCFDSNSQDHREVEQEVDVQDSMIIEDDNIISMSQCRDKKIPWSLFCILLLLIITFLVLIYFYPYLVMLKTKLFPFLSKNSAYNKAIIQLRKAQKEKDTAVVLVVLQELFAKVYKKSSSKITYEYMSNLLAKNTEWQAYIDQVTRYAFSTEKHDEKVDDFFNKGIMWLKKLKKI